MAKTEEQRLAYNAYMRAYIKRPEQVAKTRPRQTAYIAGVKQTLRGARNSLTKVKQHTLDFVKSIEKDCGTSEHSRDLEYRVRSMTHDWLLRTIFAACATSRLILQLNF